MTKLELKKGLFEKLSVLLLQYDFVLFRRMDWFQRHVDLTTQMYRLDFYPGIAGYTVAPSICLRLEQVERIFHLVSGFETKYQKLTPTIWVTVNDLTKSKSGCDYELQTSDDIDSVAEKLFTYFKDVALPFFEQNSSLEAVDKLLNDEPEKDSIYYSFYLRCYHGVIVAKLNNRSNYHQIAEIYRQELTLFADGYYLTDYERLLDVLTKEQFSEIPS